MSDRNKNAAIHPFVQCFQSHSNKDLTTGGFQRHILMFFVFFFLLIINLHSGSMFSKNPIIYSFISNEEKQLLRLQQHWESPGLDAVHLKKYEIYCIPDTKITPLISVQSSLGCFNWQECCNNDVTTETLTPGPLDFCTQCCSVVWKQWNNTRQCGSILCRLCLLCVCNLF